MQVLNKISFSFLSMVLVAGFISFAGLAEKVPVCTGVIVELLVSPEAEIQAADYGMPLKFYGKNYLQKFLDFSFYSFLSYQGHNLLEVFLVQKKTNINSPYFFSQNQNQFSSEKSDEPLPELMK